MYAWHARNSGEPPICAAVFIERGGGEAGETPRRKVTETNQVALHHDHGEGQSHDGTTAAIGFLVPGLAPLARFLRRRALGLAAAAAVGVGGAVGEVVVPCVGH